MPRPQAVGIDDLEQRVAPVTTWPARTLATEMIPLTGALS